MARRKAPEDLSVEELRRLLVEKRRGARKDRLEHYRRTGRVVSIAPDLPDDDAPLSAPVIDTTDATESTPEPVSASPRRRFMDRALLSVEVLAVIGLIVVLLNGLGLLRTLNNEVVAALKPETVTPTPLVMVVYCLQVTPRRTRKATHAPTMRRSQLIFCPWCSRWRTFPSQPQRPTRPSAFRSRRST